MMIKNLFISLLLLSLISCVTKSEEGSEFKDLAWRNKTITEVESHPYYSKLSKETMNLDNGQKIERFTYNTSEFTKPSNCHKLNKDPMKDKFCNGKNFPDKKCIHQFIFKNDRVMSYNIIGDDCYSSSCKDLPQDKECYERVTK